MREGSQSWQAQTCCKAERRPIERHACATPLGFAVMYPDVLGQGRHHRSAGGVRLGATVVGRLRLWAAPGFELPASALTETDGRPAVCER